MYKRIVKIGVDMPNDVAQYSRVECAVKVLAVCLPEYCVSVEGRALTIEAATVDQLNHFVDCLGLLLRGEKLTVNLLDADETRRQLILLQQ